MYEVESMNIINYSLTKKNDMLLLQAVNHMT